MTNRTAGHLDSETARFQPYTDIGPAERAALVALVDRSIELRKGQHLRREGDPSCGCYLLLSGWTASTIGFSNGSRLMLKVHMAGDMLGSPSLALTAAADSIVALTPATIARLPLASIGRLFETHPRIAAVLYLISQEERIFLMDRLASVGRSSMLGALATIIIQLHARIRRNDPDAGDSFEVPLTQSDLADLAGGTDVHVNRILQKLRQDGLIRWERKQVTILDMPALRAISDLPGRGLARDLSWLPEARDDEMAMGDAYRAAGPKRENGASARS